MNPRGTGFDGVVNERRIFQLAASVNGIFAGQQILNSGRTIDSIIVQVLSGALDLWLGNTDPNDGFPDFRFVSGMGPSQIWLPPTDYIVTVANPLAQVSTAVVRLMLGTNPRSAR